MYHSGLSIESYEHELFFHTKIESYILLSSTTLSTSIPWRGWAKTFCFIGRFNGSETLLPMGGLLIAEAGENT